MNMKDEISKLVVLATLVNEISSKAFEMFDIEPHGIKIDVAIENKNGDKTTHSSNIESLGTAMEELDSILSQIFPKVVSEEIVMIEQYKLHAKDREIEALKAKIAMLTDKPSTPYC